MGIRRWTLGRIGFCPAVDRAYALCYFLYRHHRWPRAYLFNDRLFRMRWNGDLLDPLRQKVTDKYLVKEYVSARAGAQYTVPTFAILRTEIEIYEYTFPEQCVVKPSHATAVALLVKDGTVDRALVKRWLHLDHYRVNREQNYAFLTPGIIVEEYALGIPAAADDFKVHCFQGVPKAIQVDQDRFGDHRRIMYDTEWNALPYGIHDPIGVPVPRPANLGEMLRVAGILSQEFDFVRVDFYTDGTILKVGEITNCHGGAGQRFIPRKAEADFSRLLFG